MGLINYTMSFGFASDYQTRLHNQKYQAKIDKIRFKQDDKLSRAQYHEVDGRLFDRMKAKRLYRKADKYQRKIDALNKRLIPTQG